MALRLRTMKVLTICALALALIFCSCSNELRRREQLETCLEDLGKIGRSYGIIVSNVAEKGMSPEEELKRVVSARVASVTNGLVLIQKRGLTYLAVVEHEPPSDLVVACSARPAVETAGPELWVIETAVPSYVVYESRIPPVPGCIYDSLSERVLYPATAVGRLEMFYPKSVADLRAVDYVVATGRQGSDLHK